MLPLNGGHEREFIDFERQLEQQAGLLARLTMRAVNFPETLVLDWSVDVVADLTRTASYLCVCDGWMKQLLFVRVSSATPRYALQKQSYPSTTASLPYGISSVEMVP